MNKRASIWLCCSTSMRQPSLASQTHSLTTMNNLSYDIWFQITSYLPDDEVKLLYAVNRALFDIAMDLRYEAVTISADLNEWPKGNDIRLFLSVLGRS